MNIKTTLMWTGVAFVIGLACIGLVAVGAGVKLAYKDRELAILESTGGPGAASCRLVANDALVDEIERRLRLR